MSSSKSLENIKEMVSPKFFEYLRFQYRMANSYRPVFRVDPSSIKPLLPKSPYILLGDPKVYRLRDRYAFFIPRPQDFGIDKARVPIPKDEPFQNIYFSKYENVAVGYGFYFPLPVPFTWLGLFRNIWQHREVWLPNVRKSSEFERLGIKMMWEQMDAGDGLGFVVDIPMEAMMGIDIVDGDGKVVSGQKMELRNFVVTLRSNHVSPGWKFNSKSVRWYIDDINLTTRRIKWAMPPPSFWDSIMEPPKDS